MKKWAIRKVDPRCFYTAGPGSASLPITGGFFDPEHYRIVLVDQRGAGRSTPHAEINENTTWDIVADLENIRRELGIADWVVMGGSWGSLLALCYAIKHPDSVAGIIIRGIFLGRRAEIDWLHGPAGAARIYPDEWERYKAPVATADDNVAAYCELLNDADDAVALAAAKSWTRWEGAMVTLFPDKRTLDSMLVDHTALSIARIESYFTNHNFFLDTDNFVLDNANVLADIPLHIIHGRYDIICPPISAWELHKAVPRSKLSLVPDGAHSPVDGGMTKELVKAADELRDKGV